MNHSYFDPDAFASAYERALIIVPENRRNQEFIYQFTLTLIQEHARLRIQLALGDKKREAARIRMVLEEVRERRGIEFILTNREALKSTMELFISSHTTYPDCPKSKRRVA